MGVDVERYDQEVDEKYLCPFCRKVLEVPVTMKCGHTLCTACLQTAVKRKRAECPKCEADLDTNVASPASSDLVTQLEELTLHCKHHKSGCDSVLPMGRLDEHMDTECEFRAVKCEHKGCDTLSPYKDLESHMERCDYRLVECKVCKLCVPLKDMPAHQAVKRCFEQLNKRRMVTSARRLSQELREHRSEIVHHRHLTDQTERRLVREHYVDCTPHKRRAMSAGPVLMGQRAVSVESRVGSAAMVVPHYSRNLRSASIESCRTCSNKFLSGRRPSAQRHSHAKVRL